MLFRFLASASVLLSALGGPALVMAAPLPRSHVKVEIAADRTAAVPGQTLTVAIREKIEPGWHTYWTNPGDSGEPTAVEWTLPSGVKAGPLLWPLPHVIPIGPLANYGYETDVTLLTEIEVPQNIEGGEVTLAGHVTYLVCKDICVPEEASVTLTLPIRASAEPSESAPQIEGVRKGLPVAFPGKATYSVNAPKEALRLTFSAEPSLFESVSEARFLPLAWGQVSNPAPQVKKLSGGELILDLKQGDTKETPEKLEGVLVLSDAAGARKGYIVAAARTPDSAAAGGLFDHASSPEAGAPGSTTAKAAGFSGGVGVALFFAFLGGMILNLMPCVFPVLALKALGFAKPAEGGHRQQGVAYMAGALCSFAVLAAFIVALRAGSASLGWGFQFQSPAFVLALAALFFFMGLSLSGVVSVGGGLMSTGDSLSRKPGNAGYFFTGALAAIAATPCTAPFMGAAIGYAVTQPAYVLAGVMLALGFGFALPVMLLSLSPALQKALPRPGAWMETLKQVLAFPLYATAAWLVWVLSIQTGSDGVMAAALALVGVGFAAWLAGKTAFSSAAVRLVAPALGIAALAAGLSLATAGQSGSGLRDTEAAFLNEEPFTKARLESLQAEGRPVFVNLTAAWCITCKVNERVALKSSAVAQAFQSAGIVYLKGDWTRSNPEITELLQRFGRAGVPLYLFYPGRGGEPRILPQLLTSSLVLEEIKTESAISTSAPAKGA
jgi:thiol:disulfide interchange protein DsbD